MWSREHWPAGRTYIHNTHLYMLGEQLGGICLNWFCFVSCNTPPLCHAKDNAALTHNITMQCCISQWWEEFPNISPPSPSSSSSSSPILLYLPGFPDYGFYSTTSDQRGPPFSFADYGSLGPQAAQLLQSEHATSACNSPLQHLPSPDQYKSPGVYHL